MAVKLIAIGIGKNKIKIGVKTVANPNPEKNVSPAKTNADINIIKLAKFSLPNDL